MAAATPWGRSALAMVRLTGAGIDAILATVLVPMTAGDLGSGRPRRVQIRDAAGIFDDGVAILRRGPATATGEDLCEIMVHGNPLIVDRLVMACVAAGAAVAAPGAFTRRAVIHGRLDLLAAEAVDQVIRATSPGGLQLGRAGLTGILGARVAELRAPLIVGIAELEARLDYPGDELALESDEALTAAWRDVAARSRALAASQLVGQALVDGVRVALVGPVNAGKSALFNRLVGSERALVHASPGTTRDVVEARCRIGPVQATILDTAGQRTTTDPVEAAGLALARRLVDDADLLIVVIRAAADAPGPVEAKILADTAERRRVVVYNGIDRDGIVACPSAWVPTSARTGAGLSQLEGALVSALGLDAGSERLVASARQRDLLDGLAVAIDEAIDALPDAGVAVAADLLTHAVASIDALTGADTREDVLDAVFARFCIGK